MIQKFTIYKEAKINHNISSVDILSKINEIIDHLNSGANKMSNDSDWRKEFNEKECILWQFTKNEFLPDEITSTTREIKSFISKVEQSSYEKGKQDGKREALVVVAMEQNWPESVKKYYEGELGL